MIACQRAKFDIPDDVAYLNCAQISPLMNAVRDAGIEPIVRRAHAWTLVHPDDWFVPVRKARGLFARLIGAETQDVALVASTSYGIAVAGKNLSIPCGARFVLPASQHESNMFQWLVRAREVGGEVIRVSKPREGDWTRPILDAIDDRTALVAVPHCDWADGMFFDLVAIGARAREVGAALVVDGMQSIGAMPFPLHEARPDFVACGTWKWLLGPANMAFLYVAPKHQSGMPLEHHGFNRTAFLDEARNSRDEDLSEEFMPGAERYDVGQRGNFIQLPMASAAMEQILAWGVAEIAESIAPLTAEINERAKTLGLTPPAEGVSAPHMTGLRFPNGPPAGIEHHLAEAQVYITIRRGLMRVSPHLYNSRSDIDRLFCVLESVMRKDPMAQPV